MHPAGRMNAGESLRLQVGVDYSRGFPLITIPEFAKRLFIEEVAGVCQIDDKQAVYGRSFIRV